jgi:hypothetical protein
VSIISYLAYLCIIYETDYCNYHWFVQHSIEKLLIVFGHFGRLVAIIRTLILNGSRAPEKSEILNIKQSAYNELVVGGSLKPKCHKD